jgi:hypothetical protein
VRLPGGTHHFQPAQQCTLKILTPSFAATREAPRNCVRDVVKLEVEKHIVCAQFFYDARAFGTEKFQPNFETTNVWS